MSEKFPQILVIPIDNRPVCYDLPLQIAKIFNGIKVFAPDISLMGDLNNQANIGSINAWVKHTIENNNIDYVLVAFDTIAYGGLIPSRRTVAKFEEIQVNVDNFFGILQFISLGKRTSF